MHGMRLDLGCIRLKHNRVIDRFQSHLEHNEAGFVFVATIAPDGISGSADSNVQLLVDKTGVEEPFT
jgi:hypothetical protein